MAVKPEFFVEYGVDDTQKALAFYEGVFDYASISAEGPIEYHVMGPLGGEASVGIMTSVLGPHSLVYFQVDEMKDLRADINTVGGKLLLEHDVPDVGQIVQF